MLTVPTSNRSIQMFNFKWKETWSDFSDI